MGREIKHPELFDNFSLWLNAEPGLQPEDGINVTDIDKIIHRFKIWRSREVQCLLGIEIKTRGADVRQNQIDTLYQFHQLMTTSIFGFQDPNGRIKKGRFENTRDVRSWFLGNSREVELKCYGMFLLRLSRTTPADSEWMEWGYFEKGEFKRQRICSGRLKQILSFEVHPISFRKDNPARRHKRGDNRPTLPLMS